MQQPGLDTFRAHVGLVEAEAHEPFELPEADLKLDTASREPDIQRVARHVHQSCGVHAEHFRRANFIKLAHLGRFYLTEADAGNPLGVTAAARSLLELDAFLRFVERELSKMAEGPPNEWRSRGARFFDVLIRARFGSSNPAVGPILEAAGVPRTLRQPYRVGECIKALAQSAPNYAWLNDHYLFLCDWVHTNQSSQTVSTAGARQGDSIVVGAGMLLLPAPATIVRHEYPSIGAAEYVVNVTLGRAAENFADATEAIKRTPVTPLRREEVVRLTGNAFGGPYLPPPRRAN